MMELEEARRRIISSVEPLSSECVSLPDATGRFLAEAIGSTLDLPPFDNSAMDGYAVRAADVQSATKEHPVRLRVLGKGPAGEPLSTPVKQGTCVRIFTGSVLPDGADAVVMQEDTTTDPQEEAVLILDAAKPWENVRLRGEDVKAGTTVLTPGLRMTPGMIALAGAAGAAELKVGRRPVVALLATGNELTEPGQTLAPGKIYESNRAMLAGMVGQAGALPRLWPIVPDAPEPTRDALAAAFAECDVVITSGGVSVGELDFVKSAFQQLNGSLEFWRVAIKPGKPFVFGRLGAKLFFGLPGNPVSAFVTFLLLVRPALARCQGARSGLAEGGGMTRLCTLSEMLANRGNRRHFIRVWVDDQGKAKLAGAQASHLLSGLAGANGLVEVPPNRVFEPGTQVPFIPLDG
jgi:molybdopterin molybdotransferase